MNNSKENTQALLRQKAEELLKTKYPRTGSQLSEAESLRLIHELEVHQLELELQIEELMEAKDVAKVANEKLTGLYDFAPSGYFTLSRKCEIIELNLAGALMLGKDRSHLINKQFNFFVSRDTLADFNLFLEKSFKSNTKESCEVNLITSGTHSLFVHLSGIATEDGTYCMVTAVDITERRLAEKKLHDIIDKNPMSIQILDREGCTIKTNSAHLNLFSAAVPPGYSLFQDPQLIQQGFGALFDRIKSGEVVSFPDSYFNVHDFDPSLPDSPVAIKVIGFPLIDSNGLPENIVLMQENITERKQAQQKLQASEERYHAIFQGSHDGILIADAESKMITYANAAQCHLFGYTEEQFKTMSIADIHPQDTFVYTLAVFESMLRGEKALAESIQCLKRNGDIFYADISGALISLNGKTQLLGFFRDITERKVAENALKASEEKYRKDLIFLQSILESPITIVIFSIDKNYCYTKFSVSHKETMKKIWGVDIQDGMNMLDLISNPEDRGKAKNNFDRAFNGDYFILTEEYGEKEFSRIFYDNYYNPVYDDEGIIVGISVFVLDVTQRKQAEQKITELNTNLEKTVNDRTEQYQEALGRLEKIADRVPGVVYQFQLNPDGSSSFPFSSDGIRDIYRVSPDEVIQDASIVFSRIHPDDLADVGASIQTSAKNQTLWQQEYRVKFDDGTVRWLSGNAQPETEADGTILWHGYISDITERKQAEDDLKESTERHRGLSEAAFDSIFFSEKGLCIEQNLMAEKIFGYTNEEAIGRYGTEWIIEADRKKVMDNMIAGYEEPYEVTAIRKDGTTFPCILSGRMMYYKGRNVRVTSLSDITQRKQAEEALIKAKGEAVKANIAKSEFLSRMSHELRTPMNSILGFAQLLEMAELNPKQKKGVNHILTSGKHLLKLIDEVLDISRIEAGKLILSPEKVQVGRIINEMLDSVQHLIASRHIKMEMNISSSDEQPIIADRQRLKQVLLNLLSNAVKYNKEGGTITISTSFLSQSDGSDAFVRISISDTGNGISEAGMAKIFTPFERIGAEKTQTEGTGLGLSVVKKLMDAMGGNLGVESTPGVGSTFWIELPIAGNAKSHKQLRDENIKLTADLGVANTEIGFQNEEKGKRADELKVANIELAFQNEEKTKRADELIDAKSEIDFLTGQNREQATKLDNANKELSFFIIPSSIPNTTQLAKTGTILYIEDNESNIELIQQILADQRPYIQLLSNFTGKETVRMAIDCAAELILLDLDLPDINGNEVLEKLKADLHTKSIPVIIISADAMPYQVEQLMKAGAAAYLTKPFDVVQFLTTIDQFIKI